jgi:hypothetical protein
MLPQLSQSQRQLAWDGVVLGAKLPPALGHRDQPLLQEEAQAESSLHREASTELPQRPMVLVDVSPCAFRGCAQLDEAVDNVTSGFAVPKHYRPQTPSDVRIQALHRALFGIGAEEEEANPAEQVPVETVDTVRERLPPA